MIKRLTKTLEGIGNIIPKGISIDKQNQSDFDNFVKSSLLTSFWVIKSGLESRSLAATYIAYSSWIILTEVFSVGSTL